MSKKQRKEAAKKGQLSELDQKKLATWRSIKAIPGKEVQEATKSIYRAGLTYHVTRMTLQRKFQLSMLALSKPTPEDAYDRAKELLTKWRQEDGQA